MSEMWPDTAADDEPTERVDAESSQLVDDEFDEPREFEEPRELDGSEGEEPGDEPAADGAEARLDERVDRFDEELGERAEEQPGGEAETGYEPTGDPAVDEVLAGMVDLAELAPADQVARYDAVHRQLHEILIGAGQETPTAPDDSGA